MDDYACKGFAFPLRLLDPALLAELLAVLPLAQITEMGMGHLSLLDSHLHMAAHHPKGQPAQPWTDALRRVATESPKLTAAVAEALGMDLTEGGGGQVADNTDSGRMPVLISTDLFCKPANDSKFVGWHQDQSWWRLLPGDKLVNVWTSLDKLGTDRDSACIQLLPGSHLSKSSSENTTDGTFPHVQNIPGNVLQFSVAVGEQQQVEAVHAELAQGESLLFSGLVVHWSPPNSSNRPRSGFVMRFTVPDYSLATISMLEEGASEPRKLGEITYHPVPVPLLPVTAENLEESRGKKRVHSQVSC